MLGADSTVRGLAVDAGIIEDEAGLEWVKRSPGPPIVYVTGILVLAIVLLLCHSLATFKSCITGGGAGHVLPSHMRAAALGLSGSVHDREASVRRAASRGGKFSLSDEDS